jgi:class 3 adenylate cyclase/predicted ATPase
VPEDQLLVKTLVFTDVVGSCRGWERDWREYSRAVSSHLTTLRAVAQACGGEEVKSLGDGLFLTFDSALQAVQFALEAQTKTNPQILLRIGIHTGEALRSTEEGSRVDYFGPAVNRAARICALANGGQTLLSDSTRAIVSAQLPSPATLSAVGSRRLHNIGMVRLWQLCHPDLPAAATTPTPPVDQPKLPAFRLPWVGDHRQIEQQVAELRSHRLISVVGPPGIGKTRFAIEVARVVAQEEGRELLAVPLDHASDEVVLWEGLAGSLATTGYQGSARAEDVLAFVASHKLVLVLDAAERSAGIGSFVDRLRTATPDLLLIVTSRRAHPALAPHVQIEPLSRDLAVRLFEAAAGKGGEQTEVERLCESLGRIPLAIELAASRAAVMTPGEMLARMDRDALLANPLKEALTLTLQMLAPEEREALLLASLFGGEFTLDQWEAVADDAGLDLIARLRQDSLVVAQQEAGRTRFHLLPPIREFARQEALSDPRWMARGVPKLARTLLRDAETNLARIRTAEEQAALRALDRDLPNLLAAREHAEKAGLDLLAAELSYGVSMLLNRRGLAAKALEEARRGLEGAERAGKPVAGLHLAASFALIDLHEWEEADVQARAAEELFAEAGNERGVAQAVNASSLAAEGAGQSAEARHRADKAMEFFRSLRDEVGMASAIHNRGRIELEDPEGDKRLGEALTREALEIRRRLGDERGLAETTMNLGVLAVENQDFEQAWRMQMQSLDYSRKLDDREMIGRALYNLAETAHFAGEDPRARRLIAASRRIFQEIGSPHASLAAAFAERLDAPAEVEAPDPVSWALEETGAST